MKKIIKDNLIYILTLIISTCIICIIYMLNKVTPFGTHSLLCVDFYHQYSPMLAEYQRKFVTLYSFNMSMGIPFFRNFFNYMSSPFNILLFFTNKKGILTAFSLIIGLKPIIASLTMLYYLTKKWNKNYLYIIPSIFYAFSGYFCSYYWNIMWLDGIVFLPLITLGIERLVNKKDNKLYITSLCIMLFANYFIAYMICIYSALYFIVYTLSKYSIKNYKKIFKVSWIFTYSSLLVGILMLWELIPLADSLKSISATSNDGPLFPSSMYYVVNITNYLLAHFTGAKITTFASDTPLSPNIFCGVIIIVFFFNFILNKKISIKTKIAYLLLLFFFGFSFFNRILDYIMHGFHVPNDLPFRYSFIYVFIFTLIAAHNIKYIEKINKLITTIISSIILIILILLITLFKPDILSNTMVLLNIICLCIYYILYILKYKFKLKYNKIMLSVLLITSTVEIIIGINHNWDISQIMTFYYDSSDKTESLLSNIKDNEKFYRIGSLNTLTLDDGSWYGYNSMTSFSSMDYESLAQLQNNLGIRGNNINSYEYSETTPIYDIIFDVKYILGNTIDKTRYTTNSYENEILTTFNYSSSLAFATNTNIKNWIYNSVNPIENQNDFAYKSTGIENVLTKYNYTNKEQNYISKYNITKYTYNNNYNNNYISINDENVKFIKIGNSVYIRDGSTIEKEVDDYIGDYYSIETLNNNEIIGYTNSLEETIDIYVGYEYLNENEGFYNYTIDNDKFEEFYNIVSKNKMKIKELKDGYIKGTINIKENMTMYTSIPYDKGWKIYVDGKKIETESLANTLLIFDIEKGNHTIEFKYEILYMKVSLLISTITLIIILIVKIKKKKNRNKLKCPPCQGLNKKERI